MLRCWFNLALAGLLVTFALPLFAVLRLIAGSGSAVASVLPHFRRSWMVANFEQQRLWASNEFGFEHAIEAYEEVIDAHVWRPK